MTPQPSAAAGSSQKTKLQGKLTDAWVCGAADRAEARAGDGRNGIGHVHVVKHVKELGVKLERNGFLKRRFIRKAHIPVEEPGPVNAVFSGVAVFERVRRINIRGCPDGRQRCCKRGGVQPVRHGAVPLQALPP